MLHEILLSLSGHPSALLDTHQALAHVTSRPVALLSPPEAELLSSLGHLSRLHRQTRDHVVRIASSHPSTVCRAVATAISAHHLDKFQQKVLAVEATILKQDASTVGAYNIVPLAGIVGEFSEWIRLMEWLWAISNFMSASVTSNKSEQRDIKDASGAQLIDKLRTEAQTGYPDIEQAALHLGAVAETSWLRQLSTWLLYGRLPAFGASDFFIEDESDDDLAFSVNHKLLPKFVTRHTASSILFIGKSLNQIRSLPANSRSTTGRSFGTSEMELLPAHVEHLSEVGAPILSAKLSEAVANIRLSLSRNLLQHLLPQEKIVEILTVLNQFLLLGRGEFAMTLVAESDERTQSRHKMPIHSKSSHSQGFQGILLKEGEITQTLARSFTVLSTLGGEDDHTDDILDVAADIVHLIVSDSSNHRPGTPGRARDPSNIHPRMANVAFNDLLLSVPTTLTMDVKSPLDLFMTKSDMEVYSAINAYLLAFRRSHLHLSQLWRISSIRREYPPPPGYQYSNSPEGRAILKRRRQRNNTRTRELRKVWATCAAAIFFLSEGEAYLQGEVVRESFKHFLRWVENPGTKPILEPRLSSGSKRSQIPDLQTPKPEQHDPEALSLAHRRFLSSITYSLLLTDNAFATALRTCFTHVDELVAYVTRLQSIQQNLDLEEDEGFEDYKHNYHQEEKDVKLELDRSRRRLDSDLKTLVERLREIDSERVGAGGIGIVGREGMVSEEDYEPLKVGGVDRLLMKLDWSGEEDEDEIEELV